MPALMTPTAWDRGTKNALICLMLVLPVTFLLATATSVVSRRSLIESSCFVSAVLWVLMFSVFVGSWLRGRKGGGGVLLDCGPHPTRLRFLLAGAVFPIAGLLAGAIGGLWPQPFDRLGPIAFGLTLGIYFLILASGRLEFREEGIWSYWGLLRWGKIEYCRWSGDYTLLLQMRSRFPMFGMGALPVPPEQKQAIVEVLNKHCRVWDPDF